MNINLMELNQALNWAKIMLQILLGIFWDLKSLKVASSRLKSIALSRLKLL